MRTFTYLLHLYAEYAAIVLVIGFVLSMGLWLWSGLAAFAERVRQDR